MAFRLKSLIAEPLLHFVLIGAVLYGVSQALAPEERDPNVVEVGAPVYRHLVDLFQKDRGRPPTAEEMDRMVDLHVKNEVLYREAMSLGLDDGDEMIRERLAQRMRFMMYSQITVPVPDDETVKAWLAKDPGRYETPATVSFHVIGLDGTREEAAAMAERANAREAEGNPLEATEVYLARFEKRPRIQMLRLFGESFLGAIEALPKDIWTPVDSPRGWQVAKLIGTTPRQPAAFEDVAATARADWMEEQKQAEARAALDRLMERYPADIAPYGDFVVPTDDAAAGPGNGGAEPGDGIAAGAADGTPRNAAAEQ